MRAHRLHRLELPRWPSHKPPNLSHVRSWRCVPPSPGVYEHECLVVIIMSIHHLAEQIVDLLRQIAIVEDVDGRSCEVSVVASNPIFVNTANVKFMEGEILAKSKPESWNPDGGVVDHQHKVVLIRNQQNPINVQHPFTSTQGSSQRQGSAG